MRISISNPSDFLALIVRRKWWVIGPFLALTGALTLLVYLLPKVYVSETLILVRPREIPTDIVRDLLSGSNTQRLKAIEQTVLSKANLQAILREYGSRMLEFSPLNTDERILKLRDQIGINFEVQRQADGAGMITYFRISYQDRDPEVAQKIASKLTALFLEQDNQDRIRFVFETTEFLTTELGKLSTQLEESEGKLRKVKSANLHQLPGQIEANLRTLERLAMDKKSNGEALDRVATLRLNLEQLMAETPDLIPKAPAPIRPVPPPTPVAVAQVKAQQIQIKVLDKQAILADALADAQMRTRLDELQKAQAELDDALINHTPDHPDVIRAERRVTRAKAQIPDQILNPPKVAEESSSVATVAQDSTISPVDALPALAGIESPIEMVPNPIYGGQARQLKELRTEQEIRERDKVFIEREIQKFSERVDRTPAVEQEIASMLRENEDLKKQFDDLSGKLAQAKLAESLESRQKGAQFVIVDPANYPLSPQKPEKGRVALGAGAFSLLLALALAITVDVGRQRVWAASEVEALWGVPVLVDIPEILVDTDVPVARKKWQWQMGSVMAAAAVYSVCLYGIYLKHGFILRQLDPLLQKIVYK